MELVDKYDHVFGAVFISSITVLYAFLELAPVILCRDHESQVQYDEPLVP